MFVINNFAHAQFATYITNFDYKNINKNAFYPMHGWNNNQQYALTLLKRSHQMQRIISSKNDTAFNWKNVIGEKVVYAKDSLLLFFIRPNDSVVRPCIFISHGNNNYYRTEWNAQMNFYVLDLVMRGYCVAYYENPTGFEARKIYARQTDSLFKFFNARSIYYSALQSSVAANIYIKHFASHFKVDTSLFFAGGQSFGALTSLQYATSNQGVNFTDSIFRYQGSFIKKALFNDAYKNDIKRVYSVDGALLKNDTVFSRSSKIGEFLNQQDSSLAFLFLHGFKDYLVSANTTALNFLTNNFPDTIYAEGAYQLVNKRNKLHLNNDMKIIINCEGGHSYFQSVCGNAKPNCLLQYQIPYLPEPPDSITVGSAYFFGALRDTMLKGFEYMMQQQNDICSIISDFLQKSISSNTISVLPNTLYFVQPNDSFNYANRNGYFKIKNTDCDGNPIQIILSKTENNAVNNEIKLFPNPSANIIHIETNQSINKLIIYSVLGERIEEISTKNQLNLDVDISKYAVGNYLVFMQLKDSFVTKKITVIR